MKMPQEVIDSLSPWDLTEAVKGQEGFVGGSMFKSQWGNFFPIKKNATIQM